MIQIFVDSGANLSAELREQYNIHLLPMALTINDQPAPEGLDGHEYYEALRSGAGRPGYSFLSTPRLISSGTQKLFMA